MAEPKQTEYSHPTLDKFASLRAQFDDPAFADDVVRIKEWEKETRDLIAREELADNEKIKDICAGYKRDIETMNESLRTEDSTQLPDPKRDRLIDKRNFYETFVKLFDPIAIAAALTDLDKNAQAELDHLSRKV